MNDRFRELALLLIKSLGHAVDPDLFTPDDAWAFIGDMSQYAAEKKPVPAVTQQVLHDIGIALGLKPAAPEEHFIPMLERELGPCPFPHSQVIEVVRYVRAQANGIFEETTDRAQQQKALSGGAAPPHHRFKNYDFE